MLILNLHCHYSQRQQVYETLLRLFSASVRIAEYSLELLRIA